MGEHQFNCPDCESGFDAVEFDIEDKEGEHDLRCTECNAQFKVLVFSIFEYQVLDPE